MKPIRHITTLLIIICVVFSYNNVLSQNIIFVTDDENDNEQISFLESNGYTVTTFFPPSGLASEPQSTINWLNSADLLIIGRSGASSTFMEPNKQVWNSLTVPIILNSQWTSRSTRLNWFNSSYAYHMNDYPDIAYAQISETGDIIFSNVTLIGDSLDWCLVAHDFIEVTAITNAEVLGWYDNAPLIARFEAGEEFYPGSVDYPSGSRTYFGFGNDAGGVVNFFPLTNSAKQVYLNEIERILSLPKTGLLIDSRNNHTYHTVKIGDQWWMAENLNYGNRVEYSYNYSYDNGSIEKYCYNNSEIYCDYYGALYMWKELMNYTYIPEAQGICPEGWHVPSNNDWMTLESSLGMNSSTINTIGWRGTNEGEKLKSGGITGFDALMAGKREFYDGFQELGTNCYFWTSDSASRGLHTTDDKIYYAVDDNHILVYSLRCTKNSYIRHFYEVTQDYSNYKFEKYTDFNNDGYLDYFDTWEIRKNNGDNTYSYASLPPSDLVYANNVAWGDYDNDGDYDVFVTGSDWKSDPVSALLRNKGDDDFAIINNGIKNNIFGYSSWGDYDNDMDLDLLFTGSDIIDNTNTIIYRNDNEEGFIDIQAVLYPTSNGIAKWGDFDSDGLLDILISEDFTAVYKNEINTFTEVYFNADLTSSDWGDFNNDGYLDIVAENKILYYNGDNQFIESLLQGNTAGKSVDVNGDTKLDILDNENKAFIRVYGTTNSAPSIPTNLQAYRIGTKVYFSWDNSTDDLTPQNGLNYNLRIGTTSNGVQILSPMTEIHYGDVKVISLGNVNNNTSWVINDLSEGTYYWSVQAIDNSYNRSAFASEQTIEIIPSFEDINLTENEREDNVNILWCDYDGDNDLDALTDSVIYINNGSGSFTRNITNYHLFPEDAGDYDNDGDLDILSSVSIFKNNGSNNFSEINIYNQPITNGKSTFADVDNDGDLDITITGLESGLSLTKIFINNKNDSYSEIETEIIGVYNSNVCWQDFDNDGDLDLFIKGRFDNDNIYTKIYRNDGDYKFHNINENIIGLEYGSMSFIDYNKDSYLDILLAGEDEFENNKTHIYLNNSGNSFELLIVDLNELWKGSADWADYDNDGDVDIILSGGEGNFLDEEESIYRIYIHQNYQNEEFSIYEPFTTVSGYWDLYISGVYRWINYDNDDDLDIIPYGKVTERGSFSQDFYIVHSNEDWINSKPEPPDSFSISLDNYDVIFDWNNGSDAETNTNSLSYNLRVGTTSNGIDIIAPNANIYSGFNKSIDFGNVQLNNSWRLKNLPEGTYYWSVQSIDQNRTGGEWSEEQISTISIVRPNFWADTVCLGLATQFLDSSVTSSGLIDSWLWDFGDGNTSSEQNPFHNYQTAGTFDVILWAYTESGDSASRTCKVVVKSIPKTNFNVEPVCIGEPSEFINLSDTSTINVASWEWDFGNGETSTSRTNVSQTYVNTTTATLTIEAENGCTDVDTQTVYIVKNPLINLESDSVLKCPTEEVLFTISHFMEGVDYLWYNNDILMDILYTDTYSGSTLDGEYYVKASMEGCSLESNRIYVANKTAPPNPLLYANDGPNEYLIVSSNRNADFYQWFYNSELIPGANEYYHLVYSNYGEYYVELNEPGYECKARSETIKIPDTYTDIHNNALEQLLEIYPNPAKDKATLLWINPYTGKFSIQVFDIMGNLLYTEQNYKTDEEYKQIINLENFVPGIYYIKITSDKFETNKKFVIEK